MLTKAQQIFLPALSFVLGYTQENLSSTDRWASKRFVANFVAA
jgi:hypothetical protein